MIFPRKKAFFFSTGFPAQKNASRQPIYSVLRHRSNIVQTQPLFKNSKNNIIFFFDCQPFERKKFHGILKIFFGKFFGNIVLKLIRFRQLSTVHFFVFTAPPYKQRRKNIRIQSLWLRHIKKRYSDYFRNTFFLCFILINNRLTPH